MSSSFRVPAFIRPRHSFHKLRSFHLSPADTAAELQRATAQEQSLSPIPGPTTQPTIQSKPHKNRLGIVPRGGMIPLRGSTLVTLATIASLFFIMSISFAFIGEDMEEPYYKKMLDGIAIDSPGVSLHAVDTTLFTNTIVSFNRSCSWGKVLTSMLTNHH